jgi:hypothetical protein
MENTTQPTPKGWTPEVWDAFNKKMETMSAEELIEAFAELGLTFEEPEDLEKEDIIEIADELDEEDVKAYFKL